jgi:hypothetical protein
VLNVAAISVRIGAPTRGTNGEEAESTRREKEGGQAKGRPERVAEAHSTEGCGTKDQEEGGKEERRQKAIREARDDVAPSGCGAGPLTPGNGLRIQYDERLRDSASGRAGDFLARAGLPRILSAQAAAGRDG